MPTRHPRIAPFTSNFLKGIDVLAIPVVNGSVNFAGGAEIKQLLKSMKSAPGDQKLTVQALNDVATSYKHSGKAGELVEIPAKSKKIVGIFLVGVGSGSRADLVKAGSAIGRKLRGTSKRCASLCGGRAELTRAHALALALSAYQWKAGGVSEAPTFAVIRKYDYAEAQEILAGVLLARDLIHTPANIKSPQWMASQARKALAKYPVEIKVHQGPTTLSKFGGLRAVGNSSPKRPPVMIEISYQRRANTRTSPHVVLVGKGIMFDTGGVSLKRPYENMVAMKSDMAGAAAILGAIRTAAALGLNCRITGLLMCAENLLSATSQRPSDVITHYDGQTVEVINTDAEGRLVLADGLGYAVDTLDPDYLVDVATLTGAATLGLSRHYAAMYTRDGALARRLANAGDSSGDRVWHMPLVDDYIDSLRSEVADFKNIAEKPSVGGESITAALFLEKFVADSRWVHFDIAGVGRSDSDSGENPKGGTGFGVRLLTEWLKSL